MHETIKFREATVKENPLSEQAKVQKGWDNQKNISVYVKGATLHKEAMYHTMYYIKL